nr:hypothetical protein GCM10025699_46780 [Microbacterium flavescens]
MPRRTAPRASPAVLRPDQIESFAAGGDELVTGEAVALDLRPTSVILRGAGVVIDYLAYVALLIGLIVLIGLLNEGGVLDDALSQAFLIGAVGFSSSSSRRSSRRRAGGGRSAGSPSGRASSARTEARSASATPSRGHWSACSRSSSRPAAWHSSSPC